MKKIIFCCLLPYLLWGCDKQVPAPIPTPTHEEQLYNWLMENYDCSGIDTDNLFLGDIDTDPNGYTIVQGYRDKDANKMFDKDKDYFWIGIFDDDSRKNVYDYTDYDRPESYMAYGEEYPIYFVGMNDAIFLDDYFVTRLIYSDTEQLGSTGQILHYIVTVGKDGNYSRKQNDIKTDSWAIGRWSSNFFFIIAILDEYEWIDSEYYTLFRLYIHDASTGEETYKWEEYVEAPFDIFNQFAYDYFIVSPDNMLNWAIYYMSGNSLNIDIWENGEYSDSKSYTIFDKITEGEHPDRIETDNDKFSDSSARLTITRTAYDGTTEEKTAEISIADSNISVSFGQ